MLNFILVIDGTYLSEPVLNTALVSLAKVFPQSACIQKFHSIAYRLVRLKAPQLCHCFQVYRCLGMFPNKAQSRFVEVAQSYPS